MLILTLFFLLLPMKKDYPYVKTPVTPGPWWSSGRTKLCLNSNRSPGSVGWGRVGAGRETQLLPKSDGYSRIISGFASRSFGVGLHLSQNELDKVNKRRMNSEWGEYLLKNEVITVYGTTKKKKQKQDKLTLLRFFACIFCTQMLVLFLVRFWFICDAGSA